MRKTCRLLLALTLVCSLALGMFAGIQIPVAKGAELSYDASADAENIGSGTRNTNTVYSGTCGENLTWELNNSGILTISGTGAMDSLGAGDGFFIYIIQPWESMIGSIKEIVIADGVTSIGDFAFYCCYNLSSVTIPDSVTSIGDSAFAECGALNVTYCGTNEQWNQITVARNNNPLINGSRFYHNWEEATCSSPKTCSFCGVTEGQALMHTYDDDQDTTCNVCGDIREVAPTMPTDAKLKFMAPAGLSFQDYIGMQVMLKNSVAKNYQRFWVEITQVDFEGNATTITTTGTPYTSSYTVYEQQILSWSMTESVTMTLYGEKEGVIYMGETFTTSVEELALDKIPDYVADGDMARAKALVDMLNFGSAVQTAYDHNPTDLPNAELGDLSQYGTTGDPEFTAVNDITGKNSITVYSNNISMQSKVEFQFMVKTSALEGKTVVAMMGDKEATVAYEPYSSYTIIRVACGAAYMRENFTIVVNDANGNAVTCTYNVTVEAYAAAQLDGAKAPAMLALIRYGDAVAAIG